MLLSIAAVLTLEAAVHAQTAAPPRLLPGTKPGVLSTIAGKAVNAANAAMAGSLIRLRDVRFGRVVARTITDKAGQFEFKNVDTGSYLVELMSPSGDVLASSSILYVDADESLTTLLLRIPSSSPELGSLLIGAAAPSAGASAAAIISAVASSHTPAATTAGEPATSQNPTQH
jgi:hypothetical protein